MLDLVSDREDNWQLYLEYFTPFPWHNDDRKISVSWTRQVAILLSFNKLRLSGYTHWERMLILVKKRETANDGESLGAGKPRLGGDEMARACKRGNRLFPSRWPDTSWSGTCPVLNPQQATWRLCHLMTNCFEKTSHCCAEIQLSYCSRWTTSRLQQERSQRQRVKTALSPNLLSRRGLFEWKEWLACWMCRQSVGPDTFGVNCWSNECGQRRLHQKDGIQAVIGMWSSHFILPT